MKWFGSLDEALAYAQLWADFEHNVILSAMRDCAVFEAEEADRDCPRYFVEGF